MDLKLTTSPDADNPVENDLFLDPVTKDVVWLGADGSLDPVEVAQHIRLRLRFWKGEWFLGPDEGMPYLDEIFEKGITDGRIASILSSVILATPGVATLNFIKLNHDEETRTLNVSFEAVLDSGHVLNSDDYDPFIVEV